MGGQSRWYKGVLTSSADPKEESSSEAEQTICYQNLSSAKLINFLEIYKFLLIPQGFATELWHDWYIW